MKGFPVRELPYPDGLVEATACEEFSVGIEGYGADSAHVSGERANRLAGTRVPPSDRVVRGAASEELPIGAERHGVNLIRMSGQSVGENIVLRPVRRFGTMAVKDRFLGSAHNLAFGVGDLV